jgi:hypothetical protein
MEYVNQHHPALEEISTFLSHKTQNTDLPFFRVMTAFFLTKCISSLRISLRTQDRGVIPINTYVIALAPSGAGKGYSVNTLENNLLQNFAERFVGEVMPVVAEETIHEFATKKALLSQHQNEDLGVIKDQLRDELARAGDYLFSFDSGTVPATKQLRQKILMQGIGAINLQVDEIGSNLVTATELLNLFLELYDLGYAKDKLIKNTAENARGTMKSGSSPANLLLFGTPSKLLDGSATEDNFFGFLETGYARRCLFAWGHPAKPEGDISAEDLFEMMITQAGDDALAQWKDRLNELCEPGYANTIIMVPRSTSVELLRYKLWCESQATEMGDHQELAKTELNHRYFKCLKLAGVYAALDLSNRVEITHLHQAMTLVEESGRAFARLFQRERPYMRLSKFLAQCSSEMTHADLVDELPFYKGGNGPRNEMMQMASAWGYRNNIIIRKTIVDGIEFFRGETLKPVNMEKIPIAWSTHVAYNYRNEFAPWSQLGKLTNTNGLHWINHHLTAGDTGEGHRTEDNCKTGFSLVVLDVDSGKQLPEALELLSPYSYRIYTTKRHDDNENHRFRVILPMSHELKLDAKDYTQFMSNLAKWVPFEMDEATWQRSRKWESFDGKQYVNEGELLDVLPFIPRTGRNISYMQSMENLSNLPALERWFASQIAEGHGRNNLMFRYGAMLMSKGKPYVEAEAIVRDFNNKIPNPLTLDELRRTVFTSMARKAKES